MDFNGTRDFDDGVVESVLTEIGVEVVGSGGELICYCPLHPNNNTPSFSCSAATGLWICFSAACNRRGNLSQLHLELTGATLPRQRTPALADFKPQQLAPLRAPELTSYDGSVFEQLASGYVGSAGDAYMRARGLQTPTCTEFGIGYDVHRDMITVPIHDHAGNPAGIVGRSRIGKRFRNSPGLPKSKLLYNMHRANADSTVIVVEASFDVLKLWQAGYRNAVAMLGGTVSQTHAWLLNKYFDKLYVFTDNPALDTAGKELGVQLARSFDRTTMFCQYQRAVKDPGDLTETEIRWGVKNSLTSFETLL